MNSRTTLRWVVLLAVVAALPVAEALAQEGIRTYDEELRVQLDKERLRASGFDAGGWFSFAYMRYDDSVARRRRDLRRYELRGWANLSLQGGAHQFYVRGLLNYDDWDSGDNPINGRGDDFNEDIERAWYKFDFGKLMQYQTGKPPRSSFSVKVGRDFTTIGTAFVLSMPLDQIQFRANVHDWHFMALLGKTIKDSNNIDGSELVSHKQDRCFYGFELAYRGFSRHRPFAYFLTNIDHTRPSMRDPLMQRYDYSSRYLGIGSTGTLFTSGLSYSVEAVGEWGQTYSEGPLPGQDRICAMALDAQLAYQFRVQTKPRIMAEYIFATGDSDRRTSTNSTVGGNRWSTKDRAFNAFGFRDTGISLAPLISNIHIYSAGASFFPLEKIRLCKKMEVGSKVFFYQKDKAAGPISDPMAAGDAAWLGCEWDVYCNWRLTSDLALTARYGVFMPGSAYDTRDKTCRQFLYTGLVFNF
ncbi:MAG: alginate export family protein [Phycisphaerae bacterium]|nr:alginate export family protein [Phycisphaerae bacterium]